MTYRPRAISHIKIRNPGIQVITQYPEIPEKEKHEKNTQYLCQISLLREDGHRLSDSGWRFVPDIYEKIILPADGMASAAVLQAALTGMLAGVRAEQGCLRYDLNRDSDRLRSAE